MLHYIIRLDDACPKMNTANWVKVETVLDTYGIKPIVGIIPESKDPAFAWEYDTSFWTQTAARYRDKGWVIAQHGCHHLYQESAKSEFSGLSYDDQRALITKRYNILCSHDIMPTCFFAPAHAFDDVTIDVCRDLGCFDYISDGKAIYQYKYRGVLFLPSLFDTPYALFPLGIYTFVLHPNTMNDEGIKNLISFCQRYQSHFVRPGEELLCQLNHNRKLNPIDLTLWHLISVIKRVRNWGR